MGSMRVREVMNRHVETIRDDEDTTVAELLRRFGRYRHLPVINRSGALVGMLTRADLLAHAVARGKNRRRKISELVSQPLLTTSEDETIQAAAGRMVENDLHALAVTGPDGKLIGMITDDEILESVVGEAAARPSMDQVPVELLMTREPFTVTPETSLGEAAGTMLEIGARHLPVVDENQRLVGILSDRDLRSKLGSDLAGWPSAPAAIRDEAVSEVMTESPISLRPGVAVSDAIESFADDRVGALPVIDDQERLLGVLSYVDLLVWLRDLQREEPSTTL